MSQSPQEKEKNPKYQNGFMGLGKKKLKCPAALVIYH